MHVHPLCICMHMHMHASDALVASQRRITRLPTRLWGFPRPQWRALLRYEASDAERRDGAR